MCSLLNKLALAVKRENLSVIRDEHKKETIFKIMFKLINNSTDDELTAHVLLVLLQVRLYRMFSAAKKTAFPPPCPYLYKKKKFISDASDWKIFSDGLQTNIQNISFRQKRSFISWHQRFNAFCGHSWLSHTQRRRGVFDLRLWSVKISHDESGFDGTRHEERLPVTHVVTFENDQPGENRTPNFTGHR